jgi:cyclohexanone monooxygenase
MGHALQQTSAADTGLVEEVKQFDVIIIGAGVTGLYQLYCLRQRGLSVRVYEAGGGVGGTHAHQAKHTQEAPMAL